MLITGRCWKFGDGIPTDLITPHTILHLSFAEMAKYVLKDVREDFAPNVSPGDILVAGRNFGCSSGRAIAAKALKATGIGAIVAESIARTFFRNACECGLLVLECPGIGATVEDGDQLQVNVDTGEIKNLTRGSSISARPPEGFLKSMLQHGGLIPFLQTPEGQRFLNRAK